MTNEPGEERGPKKPFLFNLQPISHPSKGQFSTYWSKTIKHKALFTPLKLFVFPTALTLLQTFFLPPCSHPKPLLSEHASHFLTSDIFQFREISHDVPTSPKNKIPFNTQTPPLSPLTSHNPPYGATYDIHRELPTKPTVKNNLTPLLLAKNHKPSPQLIDYILIDIQLIGVRL